MSSINIKGKIISGTGYFFLAQIICRLTSLVGHIFLARLLLPENFGVYAVAAFTVTFFMAVFSSGLPAALLQKREEIDQGELSDFFSLQQIVALILYSVIWIGAPAMSRYFGETAIDANYIRVFSLVIVFASVRAYPCMLMERELNYKYLGAVEIVEAIMFQVSTIFFAWHGFGAWSFAWGILISRGASLTTAWILAGQMPHFGFRWNFMRRTFVFGLFLQLGNIFSLMRDAIIPLYVGKFLGMEAAGYANWAWLLATYPMFVALIFERTSYATLSRLQDQPPKFGRVVEHLFFINNLIVPGLMIVIASQADGIVHFVFTDKWRPALPLIYLISFYVGLFPSGNIAVNAINALGKSRFTFYVSAWFCFFYWIATIIFSHIWGVYGYGVAVALGSFNYLILFWYLKRLVPVRLGGAVLQPLTGVLVAGGVGYYLSHFLLPHTFWSFVASMVSTGLIYVAVIFTMCGKELRPIFKDVFNHLRARAVNTSAA